MTGSRGEEDEARRTRRAALVAAVRSLPAKLLALAVAFVLLAEILIFLPSAANFRRAWLEERAQAAFLAGLAAEAAGDMELGEEMVRDLLAGADAVAVARSYQGVSELVLGGAIGEGELVTADLTRMGLWRSIAETCEAFFAPPGRYLRIVYAPPQRSDETLTVVVPEAGLKRELAAFSGRILALSLFIAGVTGVLLYLALLWLLVRPIRRLARSMTAFQADPADPRRTVALSGRRDEIGEAEAALAAMQADVREALRQRERLAALGEAVAKINHDLRNVLASAQLVSDRLAMSRDERVANMGARLVRAIDRGVRLCADTLEYGRTRERAPAFAAVALRAALEEAAGDAFESVGAAAWENRVDALVEVEADPDHLHRIFLNLFRNAVQAMEAGPRRALSVEAETEGARVVVRVIDAGPGVPEAAREALFRPFGATTRPGGSGLGLSIARELARALGGDVRLAATGEDGSVFEVTLRRA